MVPHYKAPLRQTSRALTQSLDSFSLILHLRNTWPTAQSWQRPNSDPRETKSYTTQTANMYWVLSDHYYQPEGAHLMDSGKPTFWRCTCSAISPTVTVYQPGNPKGGMALFKGIFASHPMTLASAIPRYDNGFFERVRLIWTSKQLEGYCTGWCNWSQLPRGNWVAGTPWG